ncbi:MAG: DUF721 domain-containing protein [Fermentimonas sp.]|jgi:predicted nucleic acid-binding Zn ribbon protein
MKKRDAQPLSDLLSDFLESRDDIRGQLAERRVVKGWHEVLGEGVSSYTRSIYFKHDVLYVQLASSVLRAELQMNKENLIKRLNEHVGVPLLRDIVLR